MPWALGRRGVCKILTIRLAEFDSQTRYATIKYGSLVKQANTADLESAAERLAGSTPVGATEESYGIINGMSTKYTKEVLQDAVDNSLSFAGVLRHLGLKQAGGTQHHIIKKIKSFGIDTSHFMRQAHNKGKPSPKRKSAESILVLKTDGSNKAKTNQLRRALLESGVEHRCKECGLSNTWNNKPITLEIDHIDGNWLDNRIHNLRFLCPNCHSQQSTTNMPHKHSNKAT